MKVYEFVVTFECIDEGSEIECLKDQLASEHPMETTLYDFLYEGDENAMRFFTVDVDCLKELINSYCINNGFDVKAFDIKECSKKKYLEAKERIDAEVGDEDGINILDFESTESIGEPENLAEKFDFIIGGDDTTEKEVKQILDFLESESITYKVKRLNILRFENMDFTLVFHNIERDGVVLIPNMTLVEDDEDGYRIVKESYSKYLQHRNVEVIVVPSLLEDDDIIECFEKAVVETKIKKPVSLFFRVYPHMGEISMIFSDKKDKSHSVSLPIPDDFWEKYGISEETEF